MEIYLVGGAVRDKLLGLTVKERDWVVVGATPQEMLARGFTQVGRDFPVFLHPKTHEEYALARTERKTGRGYKGFICHASPEVTLEDDLRRRDLTINAIAQTVDGKLIDPYGGVADLRAKVLRHVSAAFAEDPVRILRVARFAARFGDFKVHASTNALMQQMLLDGEVDALVPERVWQELEHALAEKYPQRFFAVLQACDVLVRLFPEIAQHWDKIKHLLCKAAKSNVAVPIRFALLFSLAQPEAVKDFALRFKIPKAYKDLALLVVKYKDEFCNVKKLDVAKLLSLLEHADAFRRPQRFMELIHAVRLVGNKLAQENSQYLEDAYKKAANISVNQIIASLDKTKIKPAIRKARLEQLATMSNCN